MDGSEKDNYDMRVLSDLGQVSAVAWNELVQGQCGRLHPLLRHEFLHALHATGCASPATGWEPQYLTLWRQQRLLAAVPLYVKHHSYGEYVFDWSWAEAYRRQGQHYYPKWLSAIPFSPVGAPKILGSDDTARLALVQQLLRLVQSSPLSSWHGLFLAPDEMRWFEALGCSMRRSVQFHWHNRAYTDFGHFLQQLSAAKRRKIRAERRKVAQQGLRTEVLTGTDLQPWHWQFFVRCYEKTYHEHHSSPYLNLAFFERIGQAMGEQIALFMAYQGNSPVASSLCLYDGHTLFGRYWGALQALDCLHFELCYYAPIEFCITRNLQLFEGGAQGEHKLARGFEPSEMYSAHWLAHSGFAAAVERFLGYESVGLDGYLDEMREHSAFSARFEP
ncbi:MAG: GNAT family N-acetyltransferase [Burkholderiales bacterium]|jgi:predicted N-acyltransferase